MEKRRKRELRALVQKRVDPRKGIGIIWGSILSWGWAVYFLAIWFAPDNLLAHGLLLSLVLPFFVFYVVMFKRQRVVKKSIYSQDYFLCLWCQYELSDLSETGICPECGAGYRMEICQSLYRYAYIVYPAGPKDLRTREKWLWARAVRERDRVRDE